VIDEPQTARDPSHFIRMADYFAECVQENKTPIAGGEEGLRDTELMSQIYTSAGLPSL
jgi:predicted dehydrogenase